MPFQLPPEIDERVQAQIVLGIYRSPEEVLSEALDALEQRNADMGAIRAGIEDEKAGRMRSLADVDRDMRQRYGLPST
jgi:Arc/MetJ-type ribon-helix-helix transcriptional regulator